MNLERLVSGGHKWNLYLFAAKAIGGEFLPCVLLLHPYGQASLLRSHAGGLSVVSSTECMLYATSEVSAIHWQAVWQSSHPHLSHHYYPPLLLSNDPSTFPLCPQFHLSPCRYPEWCVSTWLLSASSSPDFITCKFFHGNHSSTPCCLARTHFHYDTSCQTGEPEQRKLI